jgi:hypothetical protein
LSQWVLVVRGLDTDDEGARDAEARIKAALPEYEPRCTTVRESLYDAMRRQVEPFLDQHTFAQAEHSAEPARSHPVRRTSGQ